MRAMLGSSAKVTHSTKHATPNLHHHHHHPHHHHSAAAAAAGSHQLQHHHHTATTGTTTSHTPYTFSINNGAGASSTSSSPIVHHHYPALNGSYALTTTTPTPASNGVGVVAGSSDGLPSGATINSTPRSPPKYNHQAVTTTGVSSSYKNAGSTRGGAGGGGGGGGGHVETLKQGNPSHQTGDRLVYLGPKKDHKFGSSSHLQQQQQQLDVRGSAGKSSAKLGGGGGGGIEQEFVEQVDEKTQRNVMYGAGQASSSTQGPPPPVKKSKKSKAKAKAKALLGGGGGGGTSTKTAAVAQTSMPVQHSKLQAAQPQTVKALPSHHDEQYDTYDTAGAVGTERTSSHAEDSRRGRSARPRLLWRSQLTPMTLDVLDRHVEEVRGTKVPRYTRRRYSTTTTESSGAGPGQPRGSSSEDGKRWSRQLEKCGL